MNSKEKLYAKEIIKNCQTGSMNISEVVSYLQKEKTRKYEKSIVKQVEENEKLVGRYFKRRQPPYHGMFPECWRYYKVVGARSANEFRVECLIFDEYPTYWFEYQAHKLHHAGDWYLGQFEFESFIIEDIMADSVKKMEEISPDEYWRAAKMYLNRMSVMDWECDHWRWSGVWPHEMKWKDHKDMKPEVDDEVSIEKDDNI